jgi:O-antigen/teichoic acid export membrane protein
VTPEAAASNVLARLPRPIARLAQTAAPNQAVVAVTSLAVVVLASRSLTPADFGLFASAQLAVLFCVGVAQATVLTPIVADRTVDSTRPVAEARRLALLFGAGALVVGVVGSLFLSGELRTVVLGTGLVLPGCLYWDAVRMHYQGRSAYLRLLPGDLVAAAVTIGWVAVALAVELGPLVAVLGLGAGPWAACLVTLPPWSSRWTSWRRPWPRRVSANLAGDYVISTGLDQLLTLLTAVFLSTQALGGLRLAQSALGPISTLALALSMTVLPKMRDLTLTSAGKLWWAARRFGAVAGLALAIGLALTFVPVSVGQALVGDSWEIAAPVVLAVAVYAAASALGRAATLTMLTSRASGLLVAVRAVSAPVVAVVCVLVLTRHELVLYAWTAAGLLVLSTAVLFVMAARSGTRTSGGVRDHE